MSKKHNPPLFFLLGMLLPLSSLFAQTSSNTDRNWQLQREKSTSFIKNQGQFQFRTEHKELSTIAYGYDGKLEKVLFAKNGLVIELTEKRPHQKTEAEKAERLAKKQVGFKDAEAYRAFEKDGHRVDMKTDELALLWLGANEDVKIEVEQKDVFYHSYSFYDPSGELINKTGIPSWKKLTYKGLYDYIDVVYEIHPNSGFKYSIVLHPGADISKVKLKYAKDIVLDIDGTIKTETELGLIIDHAPQSFYADNQTEIIESYYQVENNIVSFVLANYDNSKTLIIDPWTQTPNFTNTGWDCVWECERDAAGNVYVIGGTSPLQLIKYDAAGTQQWVYNTPYDTTEWLGTFAVDPAGNSYVSNGSVAKIFKVNTAAALVWNNASPGGLFASTEFWNITFNCDMTRLVIGGTGGFLPPLPYIYDIDLNTGNVLTSVQVSESSLFNVQEVRAITPTGNAKYYFLTHDSIGYIHQSLTACTQNGNDIFHVSSGIDLGYKCENWRYNNAGIMAIAHYGGFIYIHRGNQIQKRDFATANIIATAAIPGGVFNGGFGGNSVACSGIDIDDCGNIYVGAVNQVLRFDQNLTLTATYPTSSNFNVYDVEVSTAGNIIAGGSTGTSGSGARAGFIQSFSVGACAPQTIVCCDATICNLNPLCTNSAPVTIDRTTPGGTFTATCGACINAVSGTFDPSVAGVGTHTITYTLACGSETINVLVNSCTAMTVCEESTGEYTVSGGSPPYTWYRWFPGGSTAITNSAQCTACGRTWFFGTCLGGNTCPTPAGWQSYTTGTTVPAPSAFPAIVVNGNLDTFHISGPGILPSCGPLLAAGLLSFDANPATAGIMTKWAVENEQNMAYYEVQRSKDAIVWEAVGQLPSQDDGSNIQYYKLLDEAPYLGDSYYRLRQVDLIHQNSFSNVVSVFLNENGAFVQIYPNPTRSSVTIDFVEQPTTEVTIRLFDAIGQEIAINNTLNGAQCVLDLSKLAAGHYFIKIEMDGNSILRKVEKY